MVVIVAPPATDDIKRYIKQHVAVTAALNTAMNVFGILANARVSLIAVKTRWLPSFSYDSYVAILSFCKSDTSNSHKMLLVSLMR